VIVTGPVVRKRRPRTISRLARVVLVNAVEKGMRACPMDFVSIRITEKYTAADAQIPSGRQAVVRNTATAISPILQSA